MHNIHTHSSASTTKQRVPKLNQQHCYKHSDAFKCLEKLIHTSDYNAITWETNTKMQIGFAWLAHRYIDVCAVRKIAINAFCNSRTQLNKGYTTIPKNTQTFQSYCKSKANKKGKCTFAKRIPGGMTSKAAHGKATKTDTTSQPKMERISKHKEKLQSIKKQHHTACCQSRKGSCDN